MPTKKQIHALISEAITHGIEVQDFLWNDDNLNKHPYEGNKHIWISVFQKRVDKISEINFNHPSALVELRKRLLQQACLSIQALSVLENKPEYNENVITGFDDEGNPLNYKGDIVR